MSDNDLTEWLANHPKMLGVLFTSLLLLSQAGGAVAGSYRGP